MHTSLIAPLSRAIAIEDASSLKEKSLSVSLNPNPVRYALNMSTDGIMPNKNSSLSLISASGVLKTIHAKKLNKTIKLDVSFLSPGIYILKIINNNKVVYRQFVKL